MRNWGVKENTPMVPMFTHEEMEFLKEGCEKLSDESLPDEMWTTIEKIYDAIQQV